MGIALVSVIVFTSCGTKEAKSEASSECCDKNDTSACCDKNDSAAAGVANDTCSTPCGGADAKTEGEHKDCNHKN